MAGALIILKELFERIGFYAVLFFFGTLSLGWSLTAAVLGYLLPRRWQTPLGQFMLMAGCRAFLNLTQALGLIRCDLKAMDRLREDRPLIIISNHPSLIDAILLLSRLPRVVCITKTDLWNNWFFGGSLRLASYIRNNTPFAVVKHALKALRSGHHLLIFPEGTRTSLQPVGPFQAGFVVMARWSGCPVQTVFIETSSPYLAKGWVLFRKPCFPMIYRVRLGERLCRKKATNISVDEMEDYYKEELGCQ